MNHQDVNHAAPSQQPPQSLGFDVRPAAGRFVTQLEWLLSRHSFSFGQHYDPGNTRFGSLMVCNDDVVAPCGGYSTHPHRDMEIVTWVLDGELEHQDSHGHSGLITPGLAQRLSAGSGVRHSEINASRTAPVRFVQMGVLPDETGAPAYDQLDLSAALDAGGWVPVVSGGGHDAALSIRRQGASLWAARAQPGERLSLPDAPQVHLFVARGEVAVEGAGSLREGDTVRLTDVGGPAVTSYDASELLVWELR